MTRLDVFILGFLAGVIPYIILQAGRAFGW